MRSVPKTKNTRKAEAPARVDEREQLVNLRETGPVTHVSLPEDLVTTIHGVMFDLDLKLLAADLLSTGKSPTADLYQKTVAGRLDRDPVLRDAEVRFSGGGLHVLLWLAPAVELADAGDRQRWRGMVRAAQCLLPSDPTAPVLTALTRPVGSVNGKNGTTVRRLRAGRPVTPEAFRELYERARTKPFATVARILFGADRVTPCPVCKGDDRTLLAGDRARSCYGGCGTVQIDQLMGPVMAAPAAKGVTWRNPNPPPRPDRPRNWPNGSAPASAKSRRGTSSTATGSSRTRSSRTRSRRRPRRCPSTASRRTCGRSSAGSASATPPTWRTPWASCSPGCW